jgi:hypothetical protein
VSEMDGFELGRILRAGWSRVADKYQNLGLGELVIGMAEECEQIERLKREGRWPAEEQQ